GLAAVLRGHALDAAAQESPHGLRVDAPPAPRQQERALGVRVVGAPREERGPQPREVLLERVGERGRERDGAHVTALALDAPPRLVRPAGEVVEVRALELGHARPEDEEERDDEAVAQLEVLVAARRRRAAERAGGGR